MGPPSRIRVQSQLPGFYRLVLPVWLFSGFLTQLALVPGITNNVGPFEVLGAVVALVFVVRESRSARLDHPLVKVLLLIALLASLSQLSLPSSHRLLGLVQLGIVSFLAIFVFVFYNIVRRYRISPVFVLRTVAISVLIVGPWILISGAASGGDIQAAGPFRNRAHMAAYMLTSFWAVLIFALWPGLKRRDRLIGYSGLVLTLYAVAASGRRSVYLSLLLGLAALLFAFVAAHRGKRLRLLLTAVFVVGFLSSLYVVGGRLNPQTGFFKQRIGQIGERVESAVGSRDAGRGEASFFSLQRAGVKLAFWHNPILGIGWGGFTKSAYSPTGHEVHSTPLRFLAELGALGLIAYLAFVGTLLKRSAELFLRMRRTPYGLPYLVLAVATWSMTVSYVYNRHLSERTFWIFLALFLTQETFAADWQALSARFGATRPAGAAPDAQGGRLPVSPGRPSLRPVVGAAARRSDLLGPSGAG